MCLQQLKACKVSQRATWSSSGHLPMKSHDNLTVLLEESDSCGSLLHASQARAQMGSSRQVACLFPSPLVSRPTQPPCSQDKSLLHAPCVSLSVGHLPPTNPERSGQSKAAFCKQTPPSWSVSSSSFQASCLPRQCSGYPRSQCLWTACCSTWTPQRCAATNSPATWTTGCGWDSAPASPFKAAGKVQLNLPKPIAWSNLCSSCQTTLISTCLGVSV